MAAAPRGIWEQRRLGCGLGPLARLLILAQALRLLPAARAGLCPAPCACRLPLLDCSRRKLPAPSWRALSGPLPSDISSLCVFSVYHLLSWNLP